MSPRTRLYINRLRFALSAERKAFEAVWKLRNPKDSYDRCMGYFLYRREQAKGC